jgi:hypothetical protein
MVKGQPLRIGVVYQPGKRAKPVWIELNRQQVKIKETTYYWKDRVGETPLIHYAVTTEETGDLYELIFNPLNESWEIHSHKTE